MEESNEEKRQANARFSWIEKSLLRAIVGVGNDPVETRIGSIRIQCVFLLGDFQQIFLFDSSEKTLTAQQRRIANDLIKNAFSKKKTAVSDDGYNFTYDYGHTVSLLAPLIEGLHENTLDSMTRQLAVQACAKYLCALLSINDHIEQERFTVAEWSLGTAHASFGLYLGLAFGALNQKWEGPTLAARRSLDVRHAENRMRTHMLEQWLEQNQARYQTHLGDGWRNKAAQDAARALGMKPKTVRNKLTGR